MHLPVETRARHTPSNSRMARLLLLPLILLLLADIPVVAQFGSPYPGGGIGSPGGYPGGGSIGGLPIPGRRRNTQNGPTETLTGKLTRVSMSQFVIDPGDGRNITIAIERTTRFIGVSGATAKLGDFDTGDQVSIDASRDTQDYYHALRVTLQQKAASSEPQEKQAQSNSNGDSDRPVLKRSTAADVAPRPVARESDDPGPPVLRRGTPARVDNTPPAGSEPDAPRPSIKAEDANGITRRPAPPVVSTEEGRVVSQAASPSGLTSTDPVIQGAREAAMSFTESLPNYVVKQFTTRYQTDTAHGNRTSWQALDVVTADVVCENGKESYKNILVNGKAPRDAVEKTGSWSTGEFATILQGILATQTDADFRGKRSTTIVNRAAFRYDYSVEQPNSMWHVFASAQSYVPAYTGSIWIDKENFRVLRIEMSARNMPREFPLDTVESAVDYDYVLIGDQKALLPTHSEALSCVRGTSECTRNVIDFRNYKKFGADTTIHFETDKN